MPDITDPLFINVRTNQYSNTFQELILTTRAPVSEVARFTGDGQFVFGSASSISAFGFESPLQMHGSGATSSQAGISLFNWSNASDSQYIDYNKSRGATPGTHAIVQSGDNLGIWDCAGDDGTNFIQSVTLRARVDTAPGSNSMPGRLEIRITPSAGAASIERVRIDRFGLATFWGREITSSTATVTPTFTDTPIQGHVGLISTAVSAFMYWFNDAFGPTHNFIKSRGSLNSFTVVQNGDRLGTLLFAGTDGTDSATAALIRVNVDGTPGNNDMPGRIGFFTTPDGTETPVERVRIANGGNTYFPGVGTTASAANAFLDSGSSPTNELLRSTSSIRYKRDIEDLKPEYADNLLKLRPIWYRSNAKADNPAYSFYGLVAEEVANIDPRLVTWGYSEDDWEHVEIPGKQDGETDLEVRLKPNAELKPDGVTYDRLTVLLLSIVQRQKQQLDAQQEQITKQQNQLQALERRIAALEARSFD